MERESAIANRRKNLGKLADQFGGKASLALKLGRSPQQIGGMINGSKSFGEKIAREIERILGLVPLSLDEGDARLEVVEPLEGDAPQGTLTIHSLSARTEAPRAPRQADFVHLLQVDKSWLYAQKVPTISPNGLRLMSATSDNMNPAVSRGDVVLVDTAQTLVNAPGVYAITYCDTVFLYRIQILPNGDLILLSDSGTYPPIPVHNRAEIEIIGKCIGVLNAREL